MCFQDSNMTDSDIWASEVIEGVFVQQDALQQRSLSSLLSEVQKTDVEGVYFALLAFERS